MKPFRFSLRAIQTQRQHKEETAREQYAAALRASETAALRLHEASQELAAAWAAMSDLLGTGVASAELLQTRAWCNALEMRVAERAAGLERAQEGVETAWKKLMVASQEREAIERFEQKRRRIHERQAQREEQKNLDELALQLAGSRMPNRWPAHAQQTKPC